MDQSLNTAIIEGVELNVCPDCSKFGKVIAQVHRPSAKEQHKEHVRQEEQKEEKIEILVENFPEIIRKKRESLGLTQKEFAAKINEKESIVHKIETGNFIPPLSLAKKLEKVLGIKLVEEHQERHYISKGKKYGEYTLGDFIKVR